MRLIDVFQEGDRLYAWLLDNHTNHFMECRFKPRIYVLDRVNTLRSLQEYLAKQGIEGRLERGKTLKGEKIVLAISVCVGGFRGIARQILRLCRHSCELFNSDIPIEDYYLMEHGVFPTCNVSLGLGGGLIAGMSTNDSPFGDYRIPELRIARLTIETSKGLRAGFDAALLGVGLNGVIRRGDNEGELIMGFLNDFNQIDPDIIITDNGELELPYLLGRIRKYFPQFSFSRIGRDELRAEGHSYFSYGRVIRKQNGVRLRGRLHLRSSPTLYGDWSLWHAFELARVCRLTIQRANHRSPGYCISSLQLYHAHRRGFLIPRTSACVERWKSGLELFNADRGGMVLEPKLGYHEDVAEVDFTSLYPSIMVHHNISTETLYCRCCRHNRVPGLRINICQRRQGIMAEMLAPIIRRREEYKTGNFEGGSQRADALKGLLVTSFGYMGFRKSRFARIEAHQAIQAYSRELLLSLRRLAEQHGYEVLHGIVDSLWLKKAGINEAELRGFVDEAKRILGFGLKLEGIYRWIVFLPSSSNPEVAVPTRYYGVFADGTPKLRGIELRRHDTPELIRQLQLRMIRELAGTFGFREFRAGMGRCKRVAEECVARLMSGHVSQEELLISTRISKLNYSATLPQAIVADRLREQGYTPEPGDLVRYIISDADSSIPSERYTIPLGGMTSKYDKRAYSRLVSRAFKSLFSQFLSKGQLTLSEALQRANTGAKIEGIPIQVPQGTG